MMTINRNDEKNCVSHGLKLNKYGNRFFKCGKCRRQFKLVKKAYILWPKKR